MKTLIAACAVTLAITHSFAAEEITWVGGRKSDLAKAVNWDPQVVPSSKSGKAYIANFTNDVEMSSSLSDFWYPAGIRVRNGSTVIFKGDTAKNNRCMPSTSCENDQFILDIGKGATLSFNGTIFYGKNANKGARHLTLMKTGEGTFRASGWFGQTQHYFTAIEVCGGTVESNCDDNKTVTESLHIANGGRYIAKHSFRTEVMKKAVQLDEGGEFKVLTNMEIPGLTGAGTVIVSKGKKLILTSDSEKPFTGKVDGALTRKGQKK